MRYQARSQLAKRLEKLERNRKRSKSDFVSIFSLATSAEVSFLGCVQRHLHSEMFADWQLCDLIINEEISAVMDRTLARLNERLCACASLQESKVLSNIRLSDWNSPSDAEIDTLDRTCGIETPAQDVEILGAVHVFDHWQGREPGPDRLAQEFRRAHLMLAGVGALICDATY